MRPMLNKNGQRYTLTQKATGAATISASTIAAIISLFLAYTNGWPLEQKALAAAGCILAGIVFIVLMWYTNKKFGINWGEIISYVLEIIRDIQMPGPNPEPEPAGTKPVARFTVTVASGPLPQTAVFKDASEAAKAWHWEFGDGTTAETKDATHAYNMFGPYDVKLTVSNENGSDSIQQTVDIKEPPMPAGVQFAQWNGATVVYILVPVWRDGGGKVINDGGIDSPDYYPIVYKNSNEDTLKLEQQGYYELPKNLVHSLVDDPFKEPDTLQDVKNQMDASNAPMDFLFEWLNANRKRADVNLEKTLLILPQSAIDQMKDQCGETGSAYDDYVNGLPKQPNGEPGGLPMAYKNWLSQHDHKGQYGHAEPILEKYW